MPDGYDYRPSQVQAQGGIRALYSNQIGSFVLRLGGAVLPPVFVAPSMVEAPAPVFLLGQGGDLGTDVSTFPDLDTTFSLMSGRRALAEAIARRLITPKGALWKHPSYGCDVRRHLNAVMTSQRLQVIKQECEQQAEEDERVLACECFVTFDDDSKAILIRVGLADKDGPFTFTAGISQLGLTLLAEQE